MNDGLNNEYQIIKAYNNKRIKELTSKQKSVINSFDSFDSDDYFIKAKKVKGNYKPDIDFIIKKKDYLVSVKKGSGNSVHQEKIETFVTFCKEYLDMSNDVEEALLYYLYGDGTLDGSGNISNRLGNDDVKKKYSKEIEVIDNFFDEHAMDLIERFLVTGRFGRDSGIIAKYLYHGTYEKGVICKLNNLSIEYIANQKKNKGNGLHIGPLTVQTWNRNLNNNPKNEYLITNFKGNQMQYSNYRREKFDNVMEKLRMEHNPHDCRHTFASLMDTANANKLCIKRIMGHSSQDITEDVYTHKSIEELIENIDLI